MYASGVGLDLNELDRMVQHLLLNKHASNTLRSSMTMFRSWITFCLAFGLPLTFQQANSTLERQLCWYTVFLATGSLQFSTVRDYVVIGVQRWHRQQLVYLELSKLPVLSDVLFSVSKCIPKSLKTRLPISADMCLQWFDLCDDSSLVDLSFFCMCAIMMYGCRRLGELAYKRIADFDYRKHLTVDCVRFSADKQTLFICWPVTKTRQQGPPLVIPFQRSSGTGFCVVSLMTKYLTMASFSSPLEPLFQRVSKGVLTGQPLIKDMFIRKMRCYIKATDPTLNVSLFSGHSFRIGAATALSMQCGLQDNFIKGIGDWLSNCYLRYIRLSLADKVHAGRSMGQLFCKLQHSGLHASHQQLRQT